MRNRFHRLAVVENAHVSAETPVGRPGARAQ
jgi:hypothetical protein